MLMIEDRNVIDRNREIIATGKLCKTFSNGGVLQHVLRNVDLRIYQGDFTVIMGPSGSGKTTLLYAISGIDPPTLGVVRFGNANITNKTNEELALFRRKNCGFVFQGIYLCDSMSLMDNVVLSGLLLDKKRKQVVRKAEQLFKQAGLTEREWSKFPAQLSGGEAQRGAIVRAMINDPTVLFADEPTGSLNASAGEAVLSLLTQANQNGQTIVMVTHDMSTALRGNRVLYLGDGVIGGQCQLGRYVSDDSGNSAVGKEAQEKFRREALHEFLSKMKW
jgi:putative ABC transport system ATP-binding protein